MKNKQIIKLSQGYIFQEFQIDRFDKNIKLEIDETSKVIVRTVEGDETRLEKDDALNLAKLHKDLIGRPLNIIIYTNLKIDNVLWGFGGVKQDGATYGVNGTYDIKISHFKKFGNHFGINVDKLTLKTKLLDETLHY